MVGIIDAIRENPRKMPVGVQMEFVNNVSAHFHACDALGIKVTSKHHFLEEMAGRPSSINNLPKLPAHADIRVEI